MDKFHPLVFILIWLYNTDINFDTRNTGNFKSWTNPNCKWDDVDRYITMQLCSLSKAVSNGLKSVFLITYTHIFVVRDLQCSVMGIYFLHPVTGHSPHPLCGLIWSWQADTKYSPLSGLMDFSFLYQIFSRVHIIYLPMHCRLLLHNFGKLDDDYGD